MCHHPDPAIWIPPALHFIAGNLPVLDRKGEEWDHMFTTAYQPRPRGAVIRRTSLNAVVPPLRGAVSRPTSAKPSALWMVPKPAHTPFRAQQSSFAAGVSQTTDNSLQVIFYPTPPSASTPLRPPKWPRAG